MEKIKIINFGPIKNVEIKIKDFLIFIGPQASGKSTISKSIYFFKSLRNDVLKYFIEAIDQNNFEKPLGNIGKRIRAKFLNFWGSNSPSDNFFIEYKFGNGKSVTISLHGKYINPTFNQNFITEFNKIQTEIRKSLSSAFKRNNKFLSASELLSIEQEKKNAIRKIEQLVNNLFENDKDLLFIPAGRSLLTTLSEQLQYIHPHKLDYLMQAFIDRINATKPLFFKSLNELIEDKEQLTNETIKYGYVKAARKIIENILKAKYVNDSEGEKLFVSDSKYVKVNFASSGQQESIWILNMIFINLLNNNKIFIIFEEPEAHLYPEAQKEIIDLIALLFNTIDSQIIITTHSPYILASLNNLLYANALQKKNKPIEDIINPKTIFGTDKLGAYSVNKGELKNIIDNETNLIKSDAIDSASSNLNNTFQKLFDIDE